ARGASSLRAANGGERSRATSGGVGSKGRAPPARAMGGILGDRDSSPNRLHAKGGRAELRPRVGGAGPELDWEAGMVRGRQRVREKDGGGSPRGPSAPAGTEPLVSAWRASSPCRAGASRATRSPSRPA